LVSDGKYIAIGGNYGTDDYEVRLYLFDGTSISEVATLDNNYTRSVAWSPDGKYLAVGNLGALKVFSFNGAVLTQEATASGGYFVSVRWSPGGKYLACATSQDDVLVYRFDGTSLVSKGSRDIGSAVRSVDWSPDGKYIAYGCTDSPQFGITRFTGSSLGTPKTYSGSDFVESVDWSPDGRYIVTGADAITGVDIFEVMDAPSGCIIDGNETHNSSGADGRGGIGIIGSGESYYIRNIASGNDANFNKAVYNVYGGGLLTGLPTLYGTTSIQRAPSLFDNLWMPGFYP